MNYNFGFNNGLMVPDKDSVLANVPKAPYYALKVSCVATGYRHIDRAIGHIALIDIFLNIPVNMYIKPKQKVCFYIYL